ncbi:hypothetical protein N8J89_03710 [Crossiella sp. CA-258035]|uniref:hypothetical protein n=1 Tax=Crossiella sp. CA-258035 TaxID=2981138 RepID=UPI0024BD5314|nr:hypothetical protein [Crossiella sp. CA-258035]WHT20190.1 hypothetical protein N8J89_03710 [Crossiella sp. CA-258035]
MQLGPVHGADAVLDPLGGAVLGAVDGIDGAGDGGVGWAAAVTAIAAAMIRPRLPASSHPAQARSPHRRGAAPVPLLLPVPTVRPRRSS